MLSAFLLLFFFLTPLLRAQTLPGVDSSPEFQRQQERERLLREQQEQVPDVRIQAPDSVDTSRIPDSETPCFTIRQIVLKSEMPVFDWALPAADLPNDPATGRCLGSQGINRVMSRIQNAIIARGFVTTRVLAEPQNLSEGTLTLTVIPGRIHAVRFSDDSDARANDWNALPAQAGDLLNLRDIEQALENFKRLRTAEADVQIVPAGEGGKPGESDVLITWKQAFPLRLSLSANDGGSSDTGKYQGSATLSGDHLLALNDLFYASFNHDLGGGDAGQRGTRGHNLHYSLPFGYWLFAATTSANRYHQSVAGYSQNYLYSGTSENYELKATRLIHRDATSKTAVSLRGYLNKSSNFIDDTEIDVQRRRMAGWEAGLAHRAFIARATLDLNLAYRRGTGAFSALPAPEQAFAEGTSRPTIITADASLALPFTLGGQNFHYSATWRAQWNRTPLVPQDRFAIGGRYTVRGFDGESVLLAERGWFVRNELGMPLGASGHEIYVGLDHGQVGGRSAKLLVGKRLTGAVIGWRGRVKNLAFDIFAGQPISKPEGFKTDRVTTGFNLSLSF
ncbi:MAG: ShlB/FhaC/HecB family hemolysin secretion/activation protein [Propionivibrio sp.]